METEEKWEMAENEKEKVVRMIVIGLAKIGVGICPVCGERFRLDDNQINSTLSLGLKPICCPCQQKIRAGGKHFEKYGLSFYTLPKDEE